jgi:hypothetical protein
MIIVFLITSFIFGYQSNNNCIGKKKKRTISEIELIFYPGGIPISGYISKCHVSCKGKKILEKRGYKYPNGEYIEKVCKGSYEKYQSLLGKLIKYDFWKLSTITPIDYPGEEPEIILDLYENLRNGKSSYKFIFRLDNREHSFQVYDIFQLKDKRYLGILEEIYNYFGLKTIKE